MCTKCGAVIDDGIAKYHICRSIDIPKPRETIFKNGTSEIKSEAECK